MSRYRHGTIGPLHFFAVGEDGTPWRPTRAWAVPTAGSSGMDMDAWELALDDPGPDVDSFAVHDLKRWMLFENQDNRWFTLSTSSPRQTHIRRVRRADAMVRYLEQLHAEVPESRRQAQLSLLIPAIGDDDARQRYLDTMRSAFPHARVLPEPEMVVEYFRLVRRTLRLDPQKNNVILVLDIGASTSNMTIVLSNRRGTLVGGETGRQRGRLQAIQGDCGDAAGQWVDEWLARRLGIELDDLPPAERLKVLAQVERAKILISQGAESAEVPANSLGGSYTLEQNDLYEAAIEVAERLEPLLTEMGRRLWDQLTATNAAKKLSADVRKSRGVDGPKTALKLVDYILLAGGTSRLRGFKELLESEFLEHAPTLLEVGDSFAIAAAVGALAHVLHEKYKPSRIRAADDDPPLDEAPLEGALDVDLLFASKRERPDRRERERRRVVIERGDPIVYTGGTIPRVFSLEEEPGTALQARLIPDVKPMRKGLSPTPIQVRARDPILGVKVDSDRRVIMQSDGIERIGNVRIDLGRYDLDESKSVQPFRGELEPGSVAFDHADELVIDFGMSKTVVVASSAGQLSAGTLDAATIPREALSPAPVGETTTADHDANRAPSDTNGETAEPTPEPEPVPEPARGPEPAPEPEPEPEPEPADAPDVEANEQPRLLRGVEGFIESLDQFLEQATRNDVDVPISDLLYTLIGLSVRPIVLLSGPPGCGKSTLARIIAHLLGRRRGRTFHEVPVQAHWTNDEPLFGPSGHLRSLVRGADEPLETHLVLFDEINLTRPEFYLTRFFSAIDRGGLASGLSLNEVFVVGTLNIDDTSRPPSPKVVDRCFLVELDQIHHGHEFRPHRPEALASLPRLAVLPEALHTRDSLASEPRIGPLLATLDATVRTRGLRQDLLPSRRVRVDLRAALQIHASFGVAAERMLPRAELVDRLISARVLAKLSGAIEQVEPLLAALEKFVAELEAGALPRTRRRIALARGQAKLGFVSPWQ